MDLSLPKDYIDVDEIIKSVPITTSRYNGKQEQIFMREGYFKTQRDLDMINETGIPMIEMWIDLLTQRTLMFSRLKKWAFTNFIISDDRKIYRLYGESDRTIRIAFYSYKRDSFSQQYRVSVSIIDRAYGSDYLKGNTGKSVVQEFLFDNYVGEKFFKSDSFDSVKNESGFFEYKKPIILNATKITKEKTFVHALMALVDFFSRMRIGILYQNGNWVGKFAQSVIDLFNDSNEKSGKYKFTQKVFLYAGLVGFTQTVFDKMTENIERSPVNPNDIPFDSLIKFIGKESDEKIKPKMEIQTSIRKKWELFV